MWDSSQTVLSVTLAFSKHMQDTIGHYSYVWWTSLPLVRSVHTLYDLMLGMKFRWIKGSLGQPLGLPCGANETWKKCWDHCVIGLF